MQNDIILFLGILYLLKTDCLEIFCYYNYNTLSIKIRKVVLIYLINSCYFILISILIIIILYSILLI